MTQRTWDDVSLGDEIGPVAFSLSIYRLVMAAGANRDFNPLHHNTEYAQSTGAPEMYANAFFLQGMWERALRDYIGLAGTIRRLSGFRMKAFNCVGDTVTVRGEVTRKWRDGDMGMVEVKIWSQTANGISVGPGVMVATLPLGAAS